MQPTYEKDILELNTGPLNQGLSHSQLGQNKRLQKSNNQPSYDQISRLSNMNKYGNDYRKGQLLHSMAL